MVDLLAPDKRDDAFLVQNSPNFGTVESQIEGHKEKATTAMKFNMSKISQEDIQNRHTFEEIEKVQGIELSVK